METLAYTVFNNRHGWFHASFWQVLMTRQKSTWQLHPHPSAPDPHPHRRERDFEWQQPSIAANVHPSCASRLQCACALSANLADDIRQRGLPALIHSAAANEYKRGVVSILFVDRWWLRCYHCCQSPHPWSESLASPHLSSSSLFPTSSLL